MYVPMVRERVEVVGHPSLFFVLKVDEDAANVELAALEDRAELLSKVAFSALRPYRPDPFGGEDSVALA